MGKETNIPLAVLRGVAGLFALILIGWFAWQIYGAETRPAIQPMSRQVPETSPSRIVTIVPQELSPASGADKATLMLEPSENNTYLKGSSYGITWTIPAWAQDLPVTLALYEGADPCSYNNRYGPTAKACGLSVDPFYGTTINTSTYEWEISPGFPSGNDYSIVLFFNGAISAQTEMFSIQ